MTRAWGRARVVTMLIAIASIARADYRTSYLDGITAYNNRSYAEAERRFRVALQERADEKPLAIMSPSGMRKAYVPRFYLGAALARQGRCDDARPELAASMNAGVLGTAPRELAEYRAVVALCPEPARKETENAVSVPSATDTSSTVGPPSSATSLPEAAPRLPQENVASPPESTSQQVPSEVRPVTPPGAAPTDPRDQATGKAVGRAFEFLVRGKYVEAIAVLNGISDAPGHARAQIHLLRSAAQYSLYELDGQVRPELRAQAVEDAIAAAVLLPNGRITKPSVFTPKFLRFYQQAITARGR